MFFFPRNMTTSNCFSNFLKYLIYISKDRCDSLIVVCFLVPALERKGNRLRTDIIQQIVLFSTIASFLSGNCYCQWLPSLPHPLPSVDVLASLLAASTSPPNRIFISRKHLFPFNILIAAFCCPKKKYSSFS